jgi:hypothetical protein
MTGDESAASYIRRVWSVYPDVDPITPAGAPGVRGAW